MEDHITAKFALGELQLRDILPLLRECRMIVTDPYDNQEAPGWDHRTEFSITNHEGEHVTEQDPDAPLILHFGHLRDRTFSIRDRTFSIRQTVKIRDGEIIAIDDDFEEFRILLVKPVDIVKTLLNTP